ncbi:hypothetical protein ACFSC3_05940 [Sphingomonas floccifaciens]|uniref:Sigma-70 family RNA polymerase sigma factor n=1 Tax=Sphingomonas floccifaciens TaxID=1844115 RepID=A0ABW4NAN3_9SPHN
MSAPVTPPQGVRELRRSEVEAEMLRVDMTPGSAILRRADQLAGDYHGEGRDLLQSAIIGALTSRSCSAGISGEQFLSGIMRSIASTARRARERRGEKAASLPVDVLAEQMGVGGYTVVAADEVIEIERVRRLCESIIETLSSASPKQAELIDGIGLGLRGRALATHLGISLDDLATIRRGLKRQALRLWPNFELGLLDVEPGDRNA